jgi:hypothetical protein
MFDIDRRKASILVDVLIVVFVVYGILNIQLRIIDTEYKGSGLHPLMMFTTWANIFAASGAAASIYCTLKEIDIPKALAVLKTLAVASLTLMMVVVLLVLVPANGWIVALDYGGILFLHLVVPILVIADYLYLGDLVPLGKRELAMTLIPVILYTIAILIILVADGDDSLAPYPFLRIHSQPLYVSAIWMVVVHSFMLLASFAYHRLASRTNPSLR